MDKKKCFKCGIEKELLQFYKHPDMPDGHVNKCKECNKKDVRDNYADKIDEKREYDNYRQRHSFSRIFNHRYMNIKHRCEGKISGGRYLGREFCSKKDFIEWCYKEENMEIFIKLWNKWRKNSFDRKDTPSIDRIDNNLHYTPDNMQWITLSKNSSKGNGDTVLITKRDKLGRIVKCKRI